VFGSKFGFERTDWFSESGEKTIPTFHKPNWFENVKKEHLGVRAGVGFFDQTSFSKMIVEGENAKEELEYIITNKLGDVGKVTYTQMCNESGGIEGDITVSHIDKNKFMIVSGTSTGIRDFTHIKKYLSENTKIYHVDNKVVLNIQGPKSKELLEPILGVDLDDKSFPFMTCKHIKINNTIPAIALRASFVGEVGWELYIDYDHAVEAYKIIEERGKLFDMVHAGYKALDCLRIEKGYK